MIMTDEPLSRGYQADPSAHQQTSLLYVRLQRPMRELRVGRQHVASLRTSGDTALTAQAPLTGQSNGRLA
jgi:hypothetical protein